jgi:predicted transcriptional regulator
VIVFDKGSLLSGSTGLAQSLVLEHIYIIIRDETVTSDVDERERK